MATDPPLPASTEGASKGPTPEVFPAVVVAQAEAAVAAANPPAPETGSSSKKPSNAGLKPQKDSDKLAPLSKTQTLGDKENEIDLSQDGLDTKAHVADDGRVNININQRSRRLSNLLVPALRSQLNIQLDQPTPDLPPAYLPPSLGGVGGKRPPQLNLVIQIVGSRGDVQPFVALGKVLKTDYGHRVRVATHLTFKSFVEENGLEFFSIGGDPAELMAFMVKNPGLLPGFDTLKSGDVGKRRKGIYEILQGCWRSCIESGDGTCAQPLTDYSDDSTSFDSGISLNSNIGSRPFIADAIIANPPSFAHVHIAEKMGIPLHMMFTMPWTPTQSFPHPLANIQSSNADASLTNFMSYALVDLMTWQGLGDLINKFREKTLLLEPVSLMWAPGMLTRLRIPYTYCWSPALIPKPKDWGNYVHISGFYFLQLASSYTPDPELSAFLEAGPPPVYIGFGSIVVDDPNAMTHMIFEAVKKAGCRALVSKGWGGLGADELGIPEGVFMLGNVPHDWLFKHVSAVVHHGGAGTTAAGIAAGKPTVVVPFFGDQPFWGSMTARAGAGPMPVPYKQLTADKLSDLITEALKPSAQEKAKKLGESIAQEKGADMGAKDFHDQLNVDNIRCSLAPSRVAVWRIKRTHIKLSALAATVLGNEGLLDFGDLKLYRAKEYEVEDGPWDPITGGASALVSTIGSLMMGVADLPVEVLKFARDKHAETEKDKSSPSGTPAVTPPARKDSKHSCLFNHRSSSMSVLSDRSGRSTPPLAESPKASPKLQPEVSHESVATVVDKDPSTLDLNQSGTEQKKVSRTNSSHLSRSDSTKISLDTYLDASKGAGRIVGTALKSPLDFTLSLAKGFHNAPKLYGDDTVRHPDKVTDLQSGLRAAGKEFGYGMYDGISGLVTQPVRGAQQEGVAGFIKGVGKGIGGVVLKPGAAIWGLPGYTFQGIYQEIQNHLGSSAQNYVIAARTAQGYEDWKSSTLEERTDIIQRFHQQKITVRRTSLHKSATFSSPTIQPTSPTAADDGSLKEPPHGFFQTRHFSFDERKKLKEERKKWKKSQKDKGKSTKQPNPTIQVASPSPHIPPTSAPILPPSADTSEEAIADEFESAIQRSITATSRGDAAQDRMIERAIRATVNELRRAQTHESQHQQQQQPQSHDVLDKALQKGVSEVHPDSRKDSTISETQDSKLLREALRHTLEHDAHHEDDEDEDERDDAFRQVLAESKAAHAREELARSQSKDKDEKELERVLEESRHDEEMRRAMQESKDEGEKLHKERTEEEIVLEYVKKQSLAEEEARKKVAKAEGGG